MAREKQLGRELGRERLFLALLRGSFRHLRRHAETGIERQLHGQLPVRHHGLAHKPGRVLRRGRRGSRRTLQRRRSCSVPGQRLHGRGERDAGGRLVLYHRRGHVVRHRRLPEPCRGRPHLGHEDGRHPDGQRGLPRLSHGGTRRRPALLFAERRYVLPGRKAGESFLQERGSRRGGHRARRCVPTRVRRQGRRRKRGSQLCVRRRNIVDDAGKITDGLKGNIRVRHERLP